MRKKEEFDITLNNKQSIADASKKLRVFSRMALTPKIKTKSFASTIKDQVKSKIWSQNPKSMRKESRKTMFDKTFGSENSCFKSKSKDESDNLLHNFSKTLMSEQNAFLAANEHSSLLEKSINFEENAENMADEGHDEDELDKDIMSAVSEFDSNKSAWIFRPDSTNHMFWDLLGFFVIFYQSIVVPYRICFDVEATGFYFYLEFSMDVYFWTDIFVCLNTGI